MIFVRARAVGTAVAVPPHCQTALAPRRASRIQDAAAVAVGPVPPEPPERATEPSPVNWPLPPQRWLAGEHHLRSPPCNSSIERPLPNQSAAATLRYQSGEKAAMRRMMAKEWVLECDEQTNRVLGDNLDLGQVQSRCVDAEEQNQ